MTPAKKITAHIEQLVAAGMFRGDIARAAGLSPSTLSKYARGERNPRPTTVVRVLSVTPTSAIIDSDGMSVADRILEEWIFMRDTLGLPTEYVIHRLSEAFRLTVTRVRQVVGSYEDSLS